MSSRAEVEDLIANYEKWLTEIALSLETLDSLPDTPNKRALTEAIVVRQQALMRRRESWWRMLRDSP